MRPVSERDVIRQTRQGQGGSSFEHLPMVYYMCLTRETVRLTNSRFTVPPGGPLTFILSLTVSREGP